MSVKVFFSWSGSLSHDLAECVRRRLPGILQFVKPYFTPEDIEKGARWDHDIAKELDESNIGLIFLTRENLNNPWILFEAGALSKKLDKAKVCTSLFGVEPSDIEGPLVGFQHTRFDKNDFKKLLNTINKEASDQKLDQIVLDDVFEMWWPRLAEELNAIIDSHKTEDVRTVRDEREILDEILELTRLTARSVPAERIHPGAIEELTEVYSMLVKAIEEQDLKSCLEFSKMLSKPIHHITRNRDLKRLRPFRNIEFSIPEDGIETK